MDLLKRPNLSKSVDDGIGQNNVMTPGSTKELRSPSGAGT